MPIKKTETSDSEVSTTAYEAKWGKQLIAAGYTVLPNVIFHYQQALKLKPLDILILLHLASFWWKSSENPRPSKTRIADAIGVNPRTVQRSIKKMEDAGYVRRIYCQAQDKHSYPNEYDLSVLVGHPKVVALAAEANAIKARNVSDKKKRTEEDRVRLATPTLHALNQRRSKESELSPLNTVAEAVNVPS